MAFKTNHSQAQQGNLMDKGEYELVIFEVSQRVTQGGTEYISIHGIVRNDVEQKYQNKHTLDSLWLSEKALPFTEGKINAIDKILEMPEAAYENYDAWGQAVRGKPIRAKVTHSKAQNGYDPREQFTYMATRFPNVQHVYQAPVSTATVSLPGAPSSAPAGFTPVSDDELPF